MKSIFSYFISYEFKKPLHEQLSHVSMLKYFQNAGVYYLTYYAHVILYFATQHKNYNSLHFETCHAKPSWSPYISPCNRHNSLPTYARQFQQCPPDYTFTTSYKIKGIAPCYIANAVPGHLLQCHCICPAVLLWYVVHDQACSPRQTRPAMAVTSPALMSVYHMHLVYAPQHLRQNCDTIYDKI